MSMPSIPIAVPIWFMAFGCVGPFVRSIGVVGMFAMDVQAEGIALPLRAILRGMDRLGRPSKTGCLDDG